MWCGVRTRVIKRGMSSTALQCLLRPPGSEPYPLNSQDCHLAFLHFILGLYGCSIFILLSLIIYLPSKVNFIKVQSVLIIFTNLLASKAQYTFSLCQLLIQAVHS